jgi:omega-6 fatty acid desaturase (delta-12 desaturase)
MTPDPTDACRQGRDLIGATRPFARENVALSWWYLLSTASLLALGTVCAAQPMPWLLRAAIAVFDGMLSVRLFILYHDHLHGSLLNGSWAARAILYPFSLWVIAAPRVWRETHNYHHAHTAKLVGSNIGSFAMMSTDQWANASRAEKLRYKAIRHPLNVLFGTFTAFTLEMGLLSFIRSPRKRWDSLLAVLFSYSVGGLFWWKLGFAAFFFCHFLPLFVAHAAGAYLFYAQHNFADAHIQPREQWSYERAALESSSFMEMNKVMHWFTGNIGYHHVHHLNPSIPFYRLPEAMAALPELQQPGRTRLCVAEIARNFSLKLWDPKQGKLVGYPD